MFGEKVHVVDHPLIKHKLGLLRENSTSTSEFRQVANELGALLCYEATRNLPLKRRFVDGWAGKVEIEEIKGKKLTVVPILRAGLGLMEGVLTMIPSAKISVLGIFRNEKTLEPVEYYEKFATDMESRLSIILDPMLATGGSACDALDALKKRGCKRIKFMAIIAAPEGVQRVAEAHPDVTVYISTLDRALNENCYILPGLGDAGDRLFGTK